MHDSTFYVIYAFILASWITILVVFITCILKAKEDIVDTNDDNSFESADPNRAECAMWRKFN